MSIRRTEVIAAGAQSALVADINPVVPGKRLQVWATTPVDGGVLEVNWGSNSPFFGPVNTDATPAVNLDEDGVCDVKIPADVKNIQLRATVQAVRVHFRYE